MKVKELADEQGLKVAQNVAAGVVGLVIWPVWFAMDAKGAASKDVAALQARQQYLTVLATERCAPRPARGTQASTEFDSVALKSTSARFLSSQVSLETYKRIGTQGLAVSNSELHEMRGQALPSSPCP